MSSILPKRIYGHSGLLVSSLGLGAAQIGASQISEKDAEHLLSFAMDHGITLFDTAPSYGLSEERIGRHLNSRRNEIVLSTKLGYGVNGLEDWTGPCITAGVEQALRILRTDRIEIAHLHSCPASTLARGDVVDALEKAKRDGKIRAIAYSGENEDLAYAIAMHRFDGFMASVNICDQRILNTTLPQLDGKGFIAKRPTANHPWRFTDHPTGDYCEEYWHRFQAMKLDTRGLAWGEMALRFSLSITGVASAIIGTGNINHLKQNIVWAANGPLEISWVAELNNVFQLNDKNWLGQI